MCPDVNLIVRLEFETRILECRSLLRYRLNHEDNTFFDDRKGNESEQFS